MDVGSVTPGVSHVLALQLLDPPRICARRRVRFRTIARRLGRFRRSIVWLQRSAARIEKSRLRIERQCLEEVCLRCHRPDRSHRSCCLNRLEPMCVLLELARIKNERVASFLLSRRSTLFQRLSSAHPSLALEAPLGYSVPRLLG